MKFIFVKLFFQNAEISKNKKCLLKQKLILSLSPFHIDEVNYKTKIIIVNENSWEN